MINTKTVPSLTKVTDNLKLFEKYIKKILGCKTQLQKDYFQKQLDILQKKFNPQERVLAEEYCHRVGEALHKEMERANSNNSDCRVTTQLRSSDSVPVLETVS